MSGYVLLEGGAEFGGRMAEADEQALKLAGGCDVQVTIIPAAAAPDNNHEHAGQTGARWFEQLGARQARLLPLVDHASANQALIAASLRDSGLIYLLGGFPRYLAQTLAHSRPPIPSADNSSSPLPTIPSRAQADCRGSGPAARSHHT